MYTSGTMDKKTRHKQSSKKPRVKLSVADSVRDVFFQTESLTIIKNDLFLTKTVKNNSIDLIVTSPPYNIDIQYNSHDDKSTYDEYMLFNRHWLARCYKWLKSDGRLCLNVPLDKNKGGQQSVGADFTHIAKEIGYQYHSTIVWNEGNISRRTAWGSWMSASAPYVIAPVELIVVLYKSEWKKERPDGENDITRQEFMDWTNGLWTFQGESKKRVGHPAPFPLELPRRCIKLFSFVGDTVLDPFLGSGTTLIAAEINDRKSIGIEIDESYCRIARDRLVEEAHVLEGSLFRKAK
jgi:site-specific DNA-methyltransferase (adenine-specific)